MHCNWRMLECLECLLEGLVARMPGMSLEGLVGHTDGFLEDLLAFCV